jgi:hypothetical protein
MPEIEIRRTNFFDGQFLRQGEFLDLDTYHRHMRRRFLFLFFNQSGVVQSTTNDLTVEIANVAQRQIRVRAGMAVGRRTDLIEAKEIVLRDDLVVDLNAQNPPLQTGDTGIVTIHYNEVLTDPSTEGGVLGDTRVQEQAVITVHRNQLPAANAPNGEPYVRLGNVVVGANTLTVDPLAPRQIAFLSSLLQAATPTISVSPNQVTAGLVVPLTVTAGGGFNLSTLPNNPGPAVIPAIPGVTQIVASNQTAASATLTLTIAANAQAGSRTLAITLNNVTATTGFTVQGGLSVTGFLPVDEPNNNVLLAIVGSGFTTPATIQFARSGGGLTPTVPLAVTAQNTSATQLLIPMAQIPTDAVSGAVRVESNNQVAFSANPVVPPPVVSTAPAQATSQTNITITGFRFVTGTAVILPGNLTRGPASIPAFPAAAFGESLTETQIVVRLISNAGASARIRVQTAGGTVLSPNILTVN